MWVLALEGSWQVEQHPQGQPRAHLSRDGAGCSVLPTPGWPTSLWARRAGAPPWGCDPAPSSSGLGVVGSWGGAQSSPAHQRWGHRGKLVGQVGCPLGSASWAQPPLAPSGGLPRWPSCTRQRAECSVPGGRLGGQGQDVLTLERAGQPAHRRLHSPETKAGPEQGQAELSHPRGGQGRMGQGRPAGHPHTLALGAGGQLRRAGKDRALFPTPAGHQLLGSVRHEKDLCSSPELALGHLLPPLASGPKASGLGSVPGCLLSSWKGLALVGSFLPARRGGVGALGAGPPALTSLGLAG